MNWVPEDGAEIHGDVTLAPGVYWLPAGLIIAADNLTLDGNGATLIGPLGQGIGLRLQGRQNVTIRNLQLQNYYHGIAATGCTGLRIESCQCHGSAEVTANTVFLDIWRPAAEAYGGAIFLNEVRDSVIVDNDLQHQMNGLLTYHSHNLTVTGNNASYSSGFGFHLYDTSHSHYADNYADYCCRYQPREGGQGHLGADAAGFLILYGSSHNQFWRNKARLGGDGFFLAGLTPAGEHRGANHNLFAANDGSYSPNIAFEGTFSEGNIYRGNIANYCNYGFWLGFSSRCTLEENQLWRNRQAGIAVENGVGMTVRGNAFHHNGHGILLWSKHVANFAAAVPENDTSRDWFIEHNQFSDNQIGIRIAAHQDHGLRPLPTTQRLAPAPRRHTIQYNQLYGHRVAIDLLGAIETELEGNQFAGSLVMDLREEAGA